ncbi:MAG: transcriptional repressor [Clostridia bacterium]|nr:transcriptional repressor [Clostridia bacterium]
MKYSKQREAIKEMLYKRNDHPTAEQLYSDLKNDFPNISLGTVYRNLSLLEQIGEIAKISAGKDSVRYDGILEPHSHFMCTECDSLIDLDITLDTDIYSDVETSANGKVNSHSLIFYGLCSKCQKNKRQNPIEVL